MVMMGQQLMDSERKQEDDEIDEYVIKPHNNLNNHRNAVTTSEEQQQKQLNNLQENMKRAAGQVPTLAALAQLTHQQNSSAGTTDPSSHNNIIVLPMVGEENGNNNEDKDRGDNNNQIIKELETNITKEEAPKINGISGGEDEEKDTPSNDCQASSVGVVGGEATTTSSGRTSSCDSSGVGTSLTSSSSSEPIEREEAVVSPPSPEENGVGAVGPPSPLATVSNGNGVNVDVPDNEGNGGVAASLVIPIPSTSSNNDAATKAIVESILPLPNGVAAASDSCQALLLCKDYNEQMTAAKKFLKMVRDGINQPTSAAGGGTSSRLRGGDSSADEDNATTTILTTPNSKSTILTNGTTPGNNNNLINTNGLLGSGIKDKNGGRHMIIGTGKIPVPVALAAALGQHSALDKDHSPTCVQEVWAHNLLEEFAKIRKVVRQYTFIAMDTEFPGIVVRPQCAVRGAGVFPYELLKVNVDRLKIIQLGVTFMDRHGKIPPGVCTWQFNFKFSLNKDLYASDSISLLTRCGIQFERHAEMGIDPQLFGEYFMSSGMVTSDQVTYLTFHSGFDFGYLIKLLSNLPLPENEEKFFEIMKIYFPNVYDLKFLMKSVDLHGGLQDIANQMGQERVGTQHQAGSDSLLTGMTFFKLLSTDVFNGEIDEAKYCGKLYGFHVNEDGTKDEGWSEIAGDNLLDAASPKPPPPTASRTQQTQASSNSNGTINSYSLLPSAQQQQSQHSSSAASTSNGNSSDNR